MVSQQAAPLGASQPGHVPATRGRGAGTETDPASAGAPDPSSSEAASEAATPAAPEAAAPEAAAA
jgi:hypothetical protein